MKLNIQINQGVEKEVWVQNDEIWLDGRKIDLDILPLGNRGFHVLKSGKSYHVEIVRADFPNPEIRINGKIYSAGIKDSLQILLESLGMSESSAQSIQHIKAPMPGLILKVLTAKGNKVEKGEPLLILEAMKMENIIKAADSCIIEDILITPGQKVEKGQNLVTLG